MEIGNYARERWNNGERDEKKAAIDYLTEALASGDPFDALFAAVYARFSDEFRRFRKALEWEVGAWDSEPEKDSAVHRPDESQQQHGGSEYGTSPVQGTNESHSGNGRGGTTSFDKRKLLLKREVWTVTQGTILWEDVTIEDVDKTVTHYEGIISGHRKGIRFLESAKRLMVAHGVERLGDVPLDEVSDILTDAA